MIIVLILTIIISIKLCNKIGITISMCICIIPIQKQRKSKFSQSQCWRTPGSKVPGCYSGSAFAFGPGPGDVHWKIQVENIGRLKRRSVPWWTWKIVGKNRGPSQKIMLWPKLYPSQLKYGTVLAYRKKKYAMINILPTPVKIWCLPTQIWVSLRQDIAGSQSPKGYLKRDSNQAVFRVTQKNRKGIHHLF